MPRHNTTEFSLLRKEVFPSADEQFPSCISQREVWAWQLMTAAPLSMCGGSGKARLAGAAAHANVSAGWTCPAG